MYYERILWDFIVYIAVGYGYVLGVLQILQHHRQHAAYDGDVHERLGGRHRCEDEGTDAGEEEDRASSVPDDAAVSCYFRFLCKYESKCSSLYSAVQRHVLTSAQGSTLCFLVDLFNQYHLNLSGKNSAPMQLMREYR